MNLPKLVDYNNIEIEAKFLLEKNFNIKEFLQLKNSLGTPVMSQTINFIQTHKHKMFIKQISFINGIQDKSKKKNYIKKSICKPIIVKGLNPYKLCFNTEDDTDNEVNEFDLIRFKLRYSILFNTPELNNWRLDCTLVNELMCTDINSLKNIRDIMFKNTNIDNFINCDAWNHTKVELELEYIKDPSMFTQDNLNAIGVLFKSHECVLVNIYHFIYKKQSNVDITLKQIGNSPIELTLNTVSDFRDKISDFYCTLKVDGERTIIMIANNKIYFCNKTKVIQPIDCSDSIILEAEFIDGFYYIYDVIKYISDTSLLPFKDRIKLLQIISKLHPLFKCKEFISLNENYIDQIKNIKSNDFKTDGLIFIEKNNNYINTKTYKWKPITTIDFIVKKCPDKLSGIYPYVA